MTLWQSPCGRTAILRHCDGVFELTHDGEAVMPPAPFAVVTYYVWAEFPPL